MYTSAGADGGEPGYNRIMLQMILCKSLRLVLIGSLIWTQSCIRHPANPSGIITIIIPNDYEGLLLILIDKDCSSKNLDPVLWDFSQSPIICAPSIHAFEEWHTLLAFNSDGSALVVESSDNISPMLPGPPALIELSTLSGTNIPQMLLLYYGDPSNITAACQVLNTDFEIIQNNPWLLRYP